MRVILASKSERRNHLLKKIIPEFETIVPEIEETFKGNSPEAIAVLNARKKAMDVGKKARDTNCIIISADTIVVVGNKILGKPVDKETARKYLTLLSGTRHRVITGICIFNPFDNRILSDFDVTSVSFNTLTEQQIEEFLNKETFYDKAGGYAIQEINDEFIKEIQGSYDNVVGLPVEKLKQMIEQFNKLQVIEIYDITLPDGYGVGKYDGKVVFVDNAVPGDKSWIKIIKNKNSYSYAMNCGIINKSGLRVEPVCPHFGTCGGCLLQNIDYGAQVEIKKKYLIETLTRIGKIKEKIDISEIIPSVDSFFYRNKMEFAFGIDNDIPVLGLRERQSPLRKYRGLVHAVDRCFIFSDCIKEIFPVFLRYVSDNNLEPYNPFSKNGFVRHLVIRETKQTNQIMVIFVTRSGTLPGISKLTEEISSIKNIKSFWWVENNQISDAVVFEKKHLIYGSPYIEEKISDFRFRIYPETFFQPNSKTAEKMYSLLRNMIDARSIKSVLGLFCGSGPIEIFLSQKAEKIIGIDNNNANISTAEENCEVNNIRNCFFHCQTSEKFLSLLSQNKDTFDLLVVDPPRGGLTEKSIKHILQINPREMLYVSCNPSTLARDLSILTENGYTVKIVVPVDMFPHTSHVETCCLLKSSR
ncbi:MAG TPA: 23S rRNA (uracil(1939)-C(5))-methyltransferase RlmD [bacterium]|nr:23S rRNA (uracil(1939)-C(5))-methyltransferase RlmD [bacterium]